MASGGDAIGSGGSAAYSVGQVLYNTDYGTNGSIIQGVQQPYEISVVLENNITGIDLSISLYPNPTSNFLILSIDKLLPGTFYQLLDIKGNLIKKDKISETQTSIQVSEILPSTYFLSIGLEGKTIKTFRFIKN